MKNVIAISSSLRRDGKELLMKTAEYCKGTGGPLILWGTDRDGGVEKLTGQLDMLISDRPYTIAAFSPKDWNADFSPWPADAEGQHFAGKGPETFAWLKEEYIPHLKQKYPETEEMYIVGYSLAGLFALWAMYETNLFAGAASCSGSLWFPGWMDYAAGHEISEGVMHKDKKIYLSLGGKEKNSRNPILAAIEDNTKLQLSILQKQTRNVKLEMNPGGHFANPMQRLAKGSAWLMNTG